MSRGKVTDQQPSGEMVVGPAAEGKIYLQRKLFLSEICLLRWDLSFKMGRERNTIDFQWWQEQEQDPRSRAMESK